MHCSVGNCQKCCRGVRRWEQQHLGTQSRWIWNHPPGDLPTWDLSLHPAVPQLRRVHSGLLALKFPSGFETFFQFWSIHDNTQLIVTKQNTLQDQLLVRFTNKVTNKLIYKRHKKDVFKPLAVFIAVPFCHAYLKERLQHCILKEPK